MEVRKPLGAAARLGAFNPLTALAVGAAAFAWGPTTATAYTSAALRTPRRLAVIDDFGQLTFFDVDQRTTRLAGGLRHLGLAAGDPVGVLCRNHRGFVEANVALAKLGARIVYLNPGLPAAQLEAVANRENLRAVVADTALLGSVEGLGDDIVRIECAPAIGSNWIFPTVSRWRPLVQLPKPFRTDDPVVLTSGTTGAPKGTTRRAGAGAASAAFGVIEALPIQRGDTVVLAAPLFHAWGLSQLITAASTASTVVLRNSFDPVQTLDDVEAYGAEVLVVVPVMINRMLSVIDEFDGTEDGMSPDLTSLRVVASSGSALPGDLATRWLTAVGPSLYSLYGSTEVGQVSVAGPEHLAADPSSAGYPLRGVDVRILDEDGNEVPAGEIGQIMVRSAMHFDGYTDGGSKEVLDEFMSIGDLGRADADGQIHVVGRVDDMIISGGENVFPGNIERSLDSSGDVDEAVVVGVADDDLGQRVRAVVVLGAGVTPASARAKLKAHLRNDLAPHEVPREFVFVSQLPRNAAGKVLRRQLTGPVRSVPDRQGKAARPEKSLRKPARKPMTRSPRKGKGAKQ